MQKIEIKLPRFVSRRFNPALYYFWQLPKGNAEMTEIDQLASDIQTSIYTIKIAEVMRWGHEDVLNGLKLALAGPEFDQGLVVNCKVSCDVFLKYGPLHERIKHVTPDYLVTDNCRYPVLMIDYLGGGHDAAQDAVKAAIAAKAGIPMIQVPHEWSFAQLQASLLAALGKASGQAYDGTQDAQALQELLKRQDFGKAAKAA